MLNSIIAGSLKHRVLVLAASAILLIIGMFVIPGIPVDIFPDLTAPSVTVLTETRGMAPEEVELLVTFPLESALNGASGVRRVRSVSAAGISVIWVEFQWGQDVYRARQVVAERVQGVALPATVSAPELGPVSSIMGEITFIALTSSDPQLGSLELRRIAETTVRRSLLSVPGISQVKPIGGDLREFQVEVDPQRLAQLGVSLDQVADALNDATRDPAAGFHVDQGQEYLVRGLGRARGSEDLASAVIDSRGGTPITVGSVATVRVGPEPKRGTASYGTRPAVILSVQKQPGANTLALTREIDGALERLAPTLPAGVTIEKENFRQADFIEIAIHNVTAALRDGALLVVAVLFLFLGNVRTTFIMALAIPLSLVAGILVFSAFGITINTMTLGGLTIGIGVLVDDAIIDIENVLRRLRLEHQKPEGTRRNALEVVYGASSEVRGAIFYATLIIALVFVPLFLLPGMEGRLLRPLGLAYITALVASFLVSLTVTPVLCYLMLANSRVVETGEPWLLRKLKALYARSLESAIAHPRRVYAFTLVLLASALAILPFLGRGFLPPFNEGSLTVSVVSAPGITLDESDAIGREVEKALLAFPEVVSTSRRTGRAEKDEHVQGVNASEMEVVLRSGRPKERLLEEMRKSVAALPGAQVSFGQPISHRIDHMISGSKSSLAVKIFGPDLSVLRGLASAAQRVLAEVPGIVDLGNQEQASIPQLLIEFDRAAMARHGVTAASLARTVEASFQGTEVGQITEEGVISRVVARFPAGLRRDREQIASLPVTKPNGSIIPLGEVARVRFDLGPSLIRREDVQRVAMLTANIAGADLAGTVEEVARRIDAEVTLPTGYRLVYGGQFEEAASSVRNLALISVLILVAMYGLLFIAFRRLRHATIVLVNLPLAVIGGVFAISLGGSGLSIAALVGFITLFGIATRNGVLLVSHYQHLMGEEGLPVEEAVRRGSMERLAPVVMTALAAGLALIPLVIAGGKPGNEIQSPMGQVILGGLVTSTFLNMVLVPVLFLRHGERRVSDRGGDGGPAHADANG
ncbi:MAG: efflux RND transporter permease subunit [Candidatus Eisenbacteria bacterium]|uniref:Efflux RND transporter permease subunit n=1 Tax=Eiseniibacteriota bacterium TaxID=2212470 RepID=A0A849SIT8_UNCEI|nr:efflux RND transporter permease subunit [Candidatus Eisenbacteria bacterium]